MAYGIFLHGVDDIDTVLSIRTAIFNSAFTTTGGLTTVQWTSEGTSVTKQWAISPMKLLEECNYFLQQEDPATYGTRISRTRPSFNNL